MKYDSFTSCYHRQIRTELFLTCELWSTISVVMIVESLSGTKARKVWIFKYFPSTSVEVKAWLLGHSA